MTPRRFFGAATFAAMLLTATSAGAVALSTSGQGDVLILPYYTVNGGQSTLIEVTGAATFASILRVRVHEARNGREVSAFNVFLRGGRTWTATIFSPGATAAAALLPEQDQCTSPNVLGMATRLPDGRHYISFTNFDYSVARADGGGEGLERTREGWIEIFKTAELRPEGAGQNAYQWLDPDVGAPDCANGIVALGDAGTGLLRPSNSPIGATVQIVDPLAGTLQGYSATALTEFRTTPLYDRNGAGPPTLADAEADPVSHTVTARIAERVASASASAGRTPKLALREVVFPADRAIDAVSAALTRSCLQQDYDITPEAGAATDWVLTFPTKPYYTDPARVGATARAPFRRTFIEHGGHVSACEYPYANVYDRESYTIGDCINHNNCETIPPPQVLFQQACFASSVIPFSDDFQSHVLKSGVVDGATFGGPTRLPFRTGFETIKFSNGNASGDSVVQGLPVVGFAAFGYVNGNVTPGVLSNYTAAAPLRDCGVRQN